MDVHYFETKEKYTPDPEDYARWKDNAKRKWAELKHEVLVEYGMKCECCGETHEKLLTIDHIHNDGKAHREDISRWHNNASRKLYKWLKENNFPKDDFQVLCFSCNVGKSLYGVCPHEEDRRAQGVINPRLTGAEIRQAVKSKILPNNNEAEA